MTEFERAIRAFEEEAEAVALAALYEKLERSKGCDMCMTEYAPEDWRDGGAHDFRVEGNTLYYFDSHAGWEGIKIRYCPNCGARIDGGRTWSVKG